MNNKDKVISLLKKESNFHGSFEDIENRINFHNIVIKDDEKQIKNIRNGCGRFKIAALCLCCAVVGVIGGYALKEHFEVNYQIINSYYTYDTYQEFESAVYNYQELYPEDEKKVFDINLNGVQSYEYRINGEIKYTNNDINNVVSFKRRVPSIWLNFKYNVYAIINFTNCYHGGEIYWTEKNTALYLYEEGFNKYIIKMDVYKVDTQVVSTVKSYISSNIHLLEA